MCVTKAFGMGIDSKDVRFVIHLNIPCSVEDMYQEIGRAGRDGLPAAAILFFKFQDRTFHLNKISQKEDTDEQNYQLGLLNSITNYCLKNKCRNKQIATYFGQPTEECATEECVMSVVPLLNTQKRT